MKKQNRFRPRLWAHLFNSLNWFAEWGIGKSASNKGVTKELRTKFPHCSRRLASSRSFLSSLSQFKALVLCVLYLITSPVSYSYSTSVNQSITSYFILYGWTNVEWRVFHYYCVRMDRDEGCEWCSHQIGFIVILDSPRARVRDHLEVISLSGDG